MRINREESVENHGLIAHWGGEVAGEVARAAGGGERFGDEGEGEIAPAGGEPGVGEEEAGVGEGFGGAVHRRDACATIGDHGRDARGTGFNHVGEAGHGGAVGVVGEGQDVAGVGLEFDIGVEIRGFLQEGVVVG